MHVGSFTPALPDTWQLRPWEPALIRPSRACSRHRLVCCQTRRGREPNCPPCAQPERGLATHLLAACLSSSLILSSCTAAHANNVKSRPQYLEAPPAAQTSGGVEKQQPSVREQVAAVEDLTRKARAAAEDGHFDKALQHYTEITRRFPGLAITERARVKRALLLYEVGQVQQALAELDDEEIALRGYAEVHAALAAILYTERLEQRQRAEEQWELANEFDHRYSDLQWVRMEKQWGPRLQFALQHFLALE